jgi:PAS domain S-box-containing protein
VKSDWKWDALDPCERGVAELLVQGKSNAAICAEVFLSRARVQDRIKRILIKTGTDSTRAAIVLLVEERETLTLLSVLDQASDGLVVAQDLVVKFANRAFHDFHGYTPGEIEDMPMIELIARRSWDLVANHHRLRLKGEVLAQRYEIGVVCKGGEEKNALVASAGLIQYRGRPATVAVVVPHVGEE